MAPLWLRSKAKKESSEPAAVHDSPSATPSRSRSKLTPCAASVKSKPFPVTPMRIGEFGLVQSHLQLMEFQVQLPDGGGPLGEHAH